jgi:hypothetical protein
VRHHSCPRARGVAPRPAAAPRVARCRWWGRMVVGGSLPAVARSSSARRGGSSKWPTLQRQLHSLESDNDAGGGREKPAGSSSPRASELCGDRRAPNQALPPRAAGSVSLRQTVVELSRWRACLPHGEWQLAGGELRPGPNSSLARPAAASTTPHASQVRWSTTMEP